MASLGPCRSCRAREASELAARRRLIGTDAAHGDVGFVVILAAHRRPLETPQQRQLTHVGQLTMLRRLHGAPIRSENYHKADIAAGRVGPDQAAPRREF